MRCIAVTRGGRLLFPRRDFVFAAHDLLYMITPERHSEDLRLLFRGDTRHAPEIRTFFGRFTLRGDALMGELAHTYGLEIAPEHHERSLAEYMRRRLRRRPVEGDVVDIDRVRLTVRTLDSGVIASAGLRLREPDEGRKSPSGRGKSAKPARGDSS